MKASILFKHGLTALTATAALGLTSCATAQPAATAGGSATKPNIVVIMGDDIGMWNIGAYSRGMMAGTDAEPRQDGQGRHVVHRLLRRGKLHGGPRELHHRRTAHPHRHDHGRPGGRARSACRRKPAPSPPRSRRRATPPASSARTIWATRMNFCPPSTASTNSSATCITWTRWKTRSIPTIRRIC